MRRASFTDQQAAILRANLQRFRAEVGYTQQETAAASEIDIDVYRNYENGRKRVTGPAVVKLAPVYDRPEAHFFMPTPPPRSKPGVVYRFRIFGLPDDQRREVEEAAKKAVEAVSERQRQRDQVEKEKARIGKKI